MSAMSASEWIAIVALAVGCAGWGLLQMWIARRDPGNPGLDRDCDGSCGRCGTTSCATRSQQDAG